MVKFALPVVYSLIALRLTGSPQFCLAVLAECIVAFLLSNVIASWNAVVSWFTGVLLLFVVYAQSLVLLFTGGYVKLIMLTNLDSIEAIEGRAAQYIAMVVISLVVMLLPIRYIRFGFVKHGVVLMLVCLLAVCWVPFVLREYSSYGNLFTLVRKVQLKNETEERIRGMTDSNVEELLTEFYSESVGDGVSRPSNLDSAPNVVLIFTEGLSMNVVMDPREIMPNVAYYMDHGLYFENYYDHTAATFRGLIGQLYSSHQYNNGDTNLLVSIQEILSQRGYETTFVNPEPNNTIFTDYLATFGFDELTSGGAVECVLPDDEVYDLIFESLSSYYTSGTPQFVAAYTFGTHVGNDAPDHVYGDGSNRLLNRFHYCDWAFGEFMTRLESSGLAANTLVVFTSDHATYVDDEYIMTFYPDYGRYDAFCDTVPLMFYYEGIEPSVEDAGGRNSLDLAPTILDYLDLDSPNYFLGTSLFLPSRDSYVEYVFCVPDSGWICYTGDTELRRLDDDETSEYMEYIEQYLALTNRTGDESIG